MKTRKGAARTSASKPEKVLLHMARTQDDWAGVAIRFDGEQPFKFHSLSGLFTWLSRLRARKCAQQRVGEVTGGSSHEPPNPRIQCN
jgi:hypothetical protein